MDEQKPALWKTSQKEVTSSAKAVKLLFAKIERWQMNVSKRWLEPWAVPCFNINTNEYKANANKIISYLWVIRTSGPIVSAVVSFVKGIV